MHSGKGQRMSTGTGLPEYQDAEQYDRENVWAADDDFYLELAKEIGGPILDAGCGTGRLTRAMAMAGLEVTGIDVTPEMLARARALSDGLEIDWMQGDVRTMQLGRRFRLITMTSHAFQHLLTDDDISSFFERARELLLDGGYLAFETRNYAAKSWGKSEEPVPWNSFQNTQGMWIDELLGGRYDPETGIEHLTFVRVTRESGEREESTSSLRYLPLEHLNNLLRRHGFTVERQYGDWQKGPLGEDQPEIISICRHA
jgi:SAM-dependent methyltransferase